MPERQPEIATLLPALIAEHAPHGFAGFMRGPGDGCPVYVAAVALAEALASPRSPLLDARGGVMNDHSQTTRDRLARLLYRMNGQPLYGRSLGDWDDPDSRIGRNEFERDRWLRQADVLLGSLAGGSDE